MTTRRVITIPFPCECMFLTPDDECIHVDSKTGKCTGCFHSANKQCDSCVCPDPCLFPIDCPLETLPADELRRTELTRSIYKNRMG